MAEPNWVVQGLFAGGLGGIALMLGQWVARKNFREKLVVEARSEDHQNAIDSRILDNNFTLEAFRSIQVEAEKLRRELRERIEDLEQEIAELRAEVESSRQDRELLHQDYVRLHEAHDKLLMEHTQLRVEHMHLQQEHNNLKQSVALKHPDALL